MAEESGVTDIAARARAFFRTLQDQICAALLELDGSSMFREDPWERPGGGGGITRVLEGGQVFEKAGVNFSEVHGELPEALARRMGVQSRGFHAAGVSLVIHPSSPLVPTVHANYRHFEQPDGNAWFGGGSDLTPYYPFDDDCRHFHTVLKQACDAVGTDYYREFKPWCDRYFYLTHRGEARGIGGVFFDNLKGEPERHLLLVRQLGEAFLPSYIPIVLRRMHMPYSEEQRRWQLVRRGRYVEFNLIYDRGTLFGLETGGRAESILMSLPPMARWDHGVEAAPGSREARLLELLAHPKEWVTE